MHSRSFHELSKEGRRIPPDPRNWPEEWTTTYFKTYPRLPHIALLDTAPPPADFFTISARRVSERFFSKNPVTATGLSLLLKYSCGIVGKNKNGTPRRAQPSAGARYPIEIYTLILKKTEGLEEGLYHYNVKDHALDVLWKHSFTKADLKNLFLDPFVKDAAVVFLMTAVFERTQYKYGERGYRYVLYEAGHIGQNLYLVSKSLGLHCSALGGTIDENIEKLLDVGEEESLVYALALGT